MAILDAPPNGWRRPTIPTRIKLQVLINQHGRCRATDAHLGKIEDVEFDHRPAIWERKFDTERNDTIPPSNDPEWIEAILISAHRARTHGIGGESRITTAGSDANKRAKLRRARKRRSGSNKEYRSLWPPKGSQKFQRRLKSS